VFSGWNPGRTLLVQVGERRETRDEIVATIARNLLWPLGLALPALGFVIWFGIERATRPLRRLNREVEARAPDNLAALDLGEAPPEVAPLVASLNRLFGRVAASIENERRFTADAAHELRTPLAGLRAQAQVARGAADEGERQHALDGVIAACDRATHLIDQLLTLARLEPDSFRAHRERCNLSEVTRLAVGEIVPDALARDIEIELAAEPAIAVEGEPRLLRIMLRNLVDNAVRYSPSRTTVRVRVDRRDGRAIVTVADEGPGVPAEDRARLGERFHRLPGTQASGTGLGLSIARRIAAIHGATLEFSATAPDRGLTVTVSLGAA
jgi:two-component system sensor histidine kinase QseC